MMMSEQSLVERLNRQAVSASATLKMLAEDKTRRNRIAEGEDPDSIDLSQGYTWPKPDETLEGQAASRIATLEQELRIVASVPVAESTEANTLGWLKARADAALTASPSGMVMVPGEPTEAMIEAGARAIMGSGRASNAVCHAYRAMLAAHAKEGG